MQKFKINTKRGKTIYFCVKRIYFAFWLSISAGRPLTGGLGSVAQTLAVILFNKKNIKHIEFYSKTCDFVNILNDFVYFLSYIIYLLFCK